MCMLHATCRQKVRQLLHTSCSLLSGCSPSFSTLLYTGLSHTSASCRYGHLTYTRPHSMPLSSGAAASAAMLLRTSGSTRMSESFLLGLPNTFTPASFNSTLKFCTAHSAQTIQIHCEDAWPTDPHCSQHMQAHMQWHSVPASPSGITRLF